jgi:hypothetical protein
VRGGRTDGAHDTLTNPRQDGLLARAAHQPIDVSPHRNPSQREELNTVLGHGGHLGCGDHLGVYADLDRFKHVAPGQVDRRRLLESERDLGFVSGNERVHHPLHIAAGEVMDLQIVDGEIESRLSGSNERIDNRRRIHLPESHSKECQE